MITKSFTCECDSCHKEIECEEDTRYHSHTLPFPDGKYNDEVEGTQVEYKNLDLCPNCIRGWLLMVCEVLNSHDVYVSEAFLSEKRTNAGRMAALFAQMRVDE